MEVICLNSPDGGMATPGRMAIIEELVGTSQTGTLNGLKM